MASTFWWLYTAGPTNMVAKLGTIVVGSKAVHSKRRLLMKLDEVLIRFT